MRKSFFVKKFEQTSAPLTPKELKLIAGGHPGDESKYMLSKKGNTTTVDPKEQQDTLQA